MAHRVIKQTWSYIKSVFLVEIKKAKRIGE